MVSIIARSAARSGSQGSHHRILLSFALLEILTDHRCSAERSIVRSVVARSAAAAGGPSESTDRPAAPAKNAQERESCILHFYTFVLLYFWTFARELLQCALLLEGKCKNPKLDFLTSFTARREWRRKKHFKTWHLPTNFLVEKKTTKGENDFVRLNFNMLVHVVHNLNSEHHSQKSWFQIYNRSL